MSIEHSPARDRRRPRRQRYTPLLIPITDAFEMIGVGRTKGYELVAAGLLPTVMVGFRRYAPRAALESLAVVGTGPSAPVEPPADHPRAA